jgi:hypothetical protein
MTKSVEHHHHHHKGKKPK